MEKRLILNILYQKDIKSYINNITKGYKVLITTRIDYDDKIQKNAKNGVWSVFARLIIIINKLNDLYTIYDMGHHMYVRKTLLKKYTLYLK